MTFSQSHALFHPNQYIINNMPPRTNQPLNKKPIQSNNDSAEYRPPTPNGSAKPAPADPASSAPIPPTIALPTFAAVWRIALRQCRVAPVRRAASFREEVVGVVEVVAVAMRLANGSITIGSPCQLRLRCRRLPRRPGVRPSGPRTDP